MHAIIGLIRASPGRLSRNSYTSPAASDSLRRPVAQRQGRLNMGRNPLRTSKQPIGEEKRTALQARIGAARAV